MSLVSRVKELPIIKAIREIRSRIALFQLLQVELTPQQKILAEKFRRGIAQAIGVPEEAIRQEIVEKWVVNWMKAMVKPEYWKQIGLE